MSYPINYPTPQGANVQIFQGRVRGAATTAWTHEWVKPQGASMVWFTLIGGGGGGASAGASTFGGGGGSSAVTNCMMPAFLIPDILQVRVGFGGAGAIAGGLDGSGAGDSEIFYQQKAGTGYTLLTAKGGGAGVVNAGGTGGAASVSNYFSAAGFFQSIAGANGNIVTASPTTFLQGGGYRDEAYTGNYGFSLDTTRNTTNGFFQMQPIIVGLGGTYTSAGGAANAAGRGGVGCGGSGVASGGTAATGGRGGDGLVVIVTW
jgi:hypothetical protein